MSTANTFAPASKKQIWAGRILSALPSLMLLMSAGMKLAQAQPAIEGMPHLGWPVELLVPLGILELGCLVFYLIPRTAVLGAILLTGYLGGAVASHLRIGEPFYIPILLGVALWGGLFLRDLRIRALIPLRG